jgi:phospholipase C
VHGPNSYLCQFKGKAAAADDANPEVEVMYQKNGNVTLKLSNSGGKQSLLKITSAYTKIDSADGIATANKYVSG